MEFSFPTTTTAAATTTPPEVLLPPAAAAGPSGPAPARAWPSCRHLPFPRFVAAASPLSLRFPRSPPPAAGMAEEELWAPEKRAGAGGDAASSSSAAAAVEELEDRMDLLWEDFNEELAQAQRRARGGSWRERGAGGGLLQLDVEGPWSASPASDAESEPAVRGCAPVLRPSARARAGSWVLLMRIFRRLFVIEKAKTISAAAIARQRSSTRAR